MLNAATQRVVALVDMDCFYCQVETRLNPSLKGKPCAVVQYNQWQGGGIIAVNYEARAHGVTRSMRGEQAKEKCPEICLVSVPSIRGKADLSNYRDAGDEVAKVFSDFSDCVQRASIDEAFLDLTKAVEERIKTRTQPIQPHELSNTFVVGHCDLKSKTEDERKKGLSKWLKVVEDQKSIESPDYRLAIGAIIIEEMRAEVFKRTGFHCSAGVAHNKILAKLTAGLHKPQKQTILPQDSIPELYETLPVYKVRNLGGKLGRQVQEKLNINNMSELYKFTLQELQQKFDEKTSSWLYNIARGIDLDPVTSRLRPESIGCCKNFPGKNQLTMKSEVEHWLRELASEISERLMKDLDRNKRRAKLLTVSFYQDSAMTRCGPLNSYEVTKIVADALDLLKKFNSASPQEDLWDPPIKYLGLSASKFAEEQGSIQKYLKTRENIADTGNQQQPTTSSFKPKPETHNEEVKAPTTVPEKLETNGSGRSFFLEFLKRRKEEQRLNQEREKQHEKEETEGENESEENPYISLTEVFPDIHQAETEVVESLPKALQKKFKERLNSEKGLVDSETGIENNTKRPKREEKQPRNEIVKEICNECGKAIPLNDFLEHIDYHAAVKLQRELNRVEVKSVTIIKTKEPEVIIKRKKKRVKSPSKKMKSITSFFNVLPKES